MRNFYHITIATVAPLATLIVGLGCQLVLNLGGDQSWIEEYVYTSEWVQGSALPSLLAAGVAIGLDGFRSLRVDRHHLLFYGNLRRRNIARYFLLVLAAYLLPLLAGMIYAMQWWYSYGGEAPNNVFLALLVHALSAAWLLSIWLVAALAFGRFSLFATPLLCLGSLYTAMNSGSLFAIGTANGSMAGYRYPGGTLKTQALAAIVGLAILWLMAWMGGRHQGPHAVRWIRGSAVLAVAMVLVSLPVRMEEFVPATAQEYSCKGEDTCVLAEHGHVLDQLQYDQMALSAKMRKLGVTNFPRQLREIGPGEDFRELPKEPMMWTPSREELANPRAGFQQSILQASVSAWQCPQIHADTPPKGDVQPKTYQALQAVLGGDRSAVDEAREGLDRIHRCGLDN